VIWVRDQAVLVFDADGVPKYWQGVMIDTTEARVSAERLAATESRYRTLVEQIPAITYIEEAGRTGRLLYISPQIETILGRSPEDWLDDRAKWLDAVHPDDLPIVTREGSTDESGGRVSMEYRMFAADGHTVWFRDESALVLDSEGNTLFWQGVMHDITEQKAAASRVNEAEERYRTLVEQIPAITYIDDRSDEGRIAYMSPQIETLTGHVAEEFMKDRDLWYSLIHPDDRERVAELLRRGRIRVQLLLGQATGFSTDPNSTRLQGRF
jgi:PAS domain S-box-containing protein